MKNLQTVIRRQLLAILMFFTSAFSIAISRFERDPQSCGMISMALRKKKKPDDGGRAC
ncbi:hypothetical protein [Pedobacter caeni]|uniref:Uncharacterized protein n=1 Tax=Pedobacter caeni TaxID=288992 RepID=A0A1M4U1T0_9SPHI|nr:hypothetical protein [Pedobacter caeni]SHE50546.1 hypothetical protein SAMN04488522_101399 [Pedobacter caeni]